MNSSTSSQNGKSVSVVVLSYRRPEMLRQALQGLSLQTCRPAEVLVIDNRSSRSDEVAAVAAQFPEFRLIANADNTGFTGGMNLGLEKVTSEYVLLSEDDMVLESRCLAALVDYASGRPEPGILSGPVRRGGTDQLIFAGGTIDLQAVFRFKIRGEGERLESQPSQPYPVEFVTGSMVFARTRTLRELGGFRPDFFMYSEDVELSLRAARFGVDLTVVPQAVATHLDSNPKPPSELVAFHKLKNFFAVYLLHAPARVLPMFFLRYGIWHPLRLLCTDRAGFVQHMRALRHTLLHLRTLWRDRLAIARSVSRRRIGTGPDVPSQA
ncbi:MAG TPA: glycosyltransferase family 2 protein [Gemmataceae bacterium]|jgi:hypothetical protein|nr:glycosyltransferase family 2 protein [Gemmataceae bacterium]